MRIVSFYTLDTLYEREVCNLLQSIAGKYPFHVKGYASRDGWAENCAIKSEFMIEMAETYDEDMVFIDADAIVKRDLDFTLPRGIHLAAHRTEPGELLSGTLFFRRETLPLLREWNHLQRQNTKQLDQRVLDEAISRLNYPFIQLPRKYVKIFDKYADDPVIEHMQASRRLKKIKPREVNIAKLNNKTRKFGVRVKTAHDGTLWIARRHAAVEKELDKELVRIPNELRWAPKIAEDYDIKQLYGKYTGKHCYLIGKGPSIDELNSLHLADNDIVICINESVRRIEPLVNEKHRLFMIQQDAHLNESCATQGTIILGHGCQFLYQDHRPRYVIGIGQLEGGITAVLAINLAKRMGISDFTLVGFDAFQNNLNYSECVGYPPTRGGQPDRFIRHAERIKRTLAGLRWKLYQLVT